MRTWLLLFLFVTLLLPVQAADTVLFERFRLTYIGKAKLFLPKDASSDRFYLTTRYRTSPVNMHMQVDQKDIVKPLGTIQTTSMPVQLTQGYGKQFTEVAAFPISALKRAEQEVIFGFTLDNGKEACIVLNKKHLERILKKIP